MAARSTIKTELLDVYSDGNPLTPAPGGRFV